MDKWGLPGCTNFRDVVPPFQGRAASSPSEPPRRHDGLMKAIFQGGPLDGREFEVPVPPPKGLDIDHHGRALRYGFERSGDDVIVYGFCEARWRSTMRSHFIYLGENVRGVALLFYPRKVIKNRHEITLDFHPRPVRTVTRVVPCDSRLPSFPSTVVSLDRGTDAQVDGDAF